MGPQVYPRLDAYIGPVQPAKPIGYTLSQYTNLQYLITGFLQGEILKLYLRKVHFSLDSSTVKAIYLFFKEQVQKEPFIIILTGLPIFTIYILFLYDNFAPIFHRTASLFFPT